METFIEAKDTADEVDHVHLYIKDNAYPMQCSASMIQQIRMRYQKFAATCRAVQHTGELDVRY